MNVQRKGQLMNRSWMSQFILSMALLVAAGCATTGSGIVRSSDGATQKFFENLERSRYDEAYAFLGKGLTQSVTFNQFEQFMSGLKQEWGRIMSEETQVLPFHRLVGESNFIPLDAKSEDIKRYTFLVKFDRAEVNMDLTLVRQNNEFKIVWFSLWGSSIYMTPEITKKIEDLFSPAP